MLVTSPLGFDPGIKAISSYRERLPPRSIPHLSPFFTSKGSSHYHKEIPDKLVEYKSKRHSDKGNISGYI